MNKEKSILIDCENSETRKKRSPSFFKLSRMPWSTVSSLVGNVVVLVAVFGFCISLVTGFLVDYVLMFVVLF